MDNYIEQTSIVKEIHNCITVGLRVHCPNEKDIHEWYLDHFMKWLKYRKYVLLAASCGVHTNTTEDHIHYHCVVKGQTLANPLATMKRDFEIGKVQTEYKYDLYSRELPSSFIDGKYKNRINMSLSFKVQTDIGKDVMNFLQYPFKEGNTILERNYNLDEYGGQDQLQAQAIAIYQASQHQQQKKELKVKKDKSEWQVICDLLDLNQPQDLDQVEYLVLNHYKSLESKPPTIRFMLDLAERYAFKKGILEIRHIVGRRRLL